ncbi:MAG TPA: glutamine amidotransferase [Steroidobacteraceae bacterium]
MRTALALTHVPFEDLGSLAEELAARKFEVQVMDACTADLRRVDALAPDLLIVMGGPIGVYESAAYPFLRWELELLRRRLAQNSPTLGICLGAQLMAAALDAPVYAGRQGKEIGWAVLVPGADARACPALAELLTPDLPVLHWHGDTFDLPRGAAHLAATARYPNQAWSKGNKLLGLQFHPEVLTLALERWYVGHASELAAARVDVPQLRSAGLTFGPALYSAARRFWRRWLDDLFK